ncbi:MAG: class I SAM-dependent methyltransferase [Chloroflexota bacterium]
MKAKPRHLTAENAARFQQPDVVALYHLRMPYPPETFEILLSLLSEPRTLLDVGTGTGDLARPLAAQVERVDAVDPSLPMIETGRQALNGAHPNLCWIQGQVEDAALTPPYGLIIGGESIHWLDWRKAFARFHKLLAPSGWIVIVERGGLPVPWDADLLPLIQRFSQMQNYESYDLAEELEKGGFFRLVGQKITAPVSWTQSVEDYIGSFHSMSGLAIAGMPPAAVTEFDNRLRELVTPYSSDGRLTLQTTAHLQWGK